MRPNQIILDIWLSVASGLDGGWACMCLSRMLLLITAVELITMPFTQYLWSWDKFLHGGHDFETGLLMIVIFVCFTLLQAQDKREHLVDLLAIGAARSRFVRRREHPGMLRESTAHTEFPIHPSALCGLPLLI